MRFVVLVLAALLAATGAHAQAPGLSPPFLRGSQAYVPSYPVYFRWAGLYFGGHAGYTAGQVDVGNGTQSLIQFLLRNTLLEQQACVSCWVTMTPRTTATGGFGGFGGYNSQWDDLILGLEVNYSRAQHKRDQFRRHQPHRHAVRPVSIQCERHFDGAGPALPPYDLPCARGLCDGTVPALYRRRGGGRERQLPQGGLRQLSDSRR